MLYSKKIIANQKLTMLQLNKSFIYLLRSFYEYYIKNFLICQKNGPIRLDFWKIFGYNNNKQ